MNVWLKFVNQDTYLGPIIHAMNNILHRIK